MLSIIIPTLNEERYLPRLLRSIKLQRYKDIEVIIADAGSKDKTKEIAKRFGAKIVKGGHPGLGRNNGVKASKGEVLLFMDADVILPEGFLKENMEEFNSEGYDLATTYVIPLTGRIDDILIHYGMNKVYWFFQKISPIAAGFHIFVKRKNFMKVNGFDEHIHLAEDHDFLCRIVKSGGRFGILKSKRINVSVRRMQREGRIMFVLKMIGAFLHIKILGPIRKDTFNYKLGNHKDDGARDDKIRMK